ncbi:MAG: mandelate racemase/muconate lactonizing enzyme family protein [Rhodospirillaceae bacterium]|nr:mandelate racemase/muconate lactonizing enzyme family protein [Rhodospirillaceae bacterium]
MPRIAAIDITHHRLPLDPPFKPSWDSRPRHHFDVTLVRVRSDDGHEGVGSGDLMLGLAGHEHLFIGQDPLALERHYRILANFGFHYGRCWPLDIALWDLAGKITGQPCWKLLGGCTDRVRAYASSGSLREPAAMAETAQRFLAEGFRAMKVRFHRGDWRDDIRALEAVRAAVGDRLTLMVDCNQGWRMAWDSATPWNLKDAVAVARELEQLSIYWMEEPLFRGDHAGMAALRQMTDLRIAGGEMTRELHEFRVLIEKGCLDVLQPDAVLVGGITGLRRVALMAEEHGLMFTPHTWGNGIGLMANLHLVAGLTGAPFLEFPYDPPEWTVQRRDYPLIEPVRIDKEGWLVLPDRPGLGIELNEELLAKTRL